jgi:hypothetical protein
MKGAYETVGELSFRARVQWRWSASAEDGGQTKITGTCKNVPGHGGPSADS